MESIKTSLPSTRPHFQLEFTPFGNIPPATIAEFQLKFFKGMEEIINNIPYCVFRPNPATIPTGKRPPFRRESGRHSDSIAATIPEQSGQRDMRV